MDYDYLKASDGNGNAALMHVETERLSGATTLDVDIVTGVPDKFIATYGALLPSGFIDPSTARDFYGHLDGANLEIDEFAPGSVDDGTPEGYVVVIKPNTPWANGVATAAKAMDTFIRTQGDWRELPVAPTVASGYNHGNKSFDLTFPGVDLSDTLSKGMRFKVDRGTAAPTQCADLEASSSQYASKTSPSGITFTDSYTVEAWIKLESYNSTSNMTVVSRYNGSTGWIFGLRSTGELWIYGRNAAGNDDIRSYTQIPLGEWVHIAATMTASTNTYTMYINGVAVPTNNFLTTATGITQAGDLKIGQYSDIGYMDGELSDVRVWSNVRTATEIQDNMNQQLTGSETGLVGYWKLDGDFNDSTSNANNLTASGGAVATATDNPWSDTEYAVITEDAEYDGTDTTATIYTGLGSSVPNEVLATAYYSTQEVPFGYPEELRQYKRQKFSVTGVNPAIWTNAAGGLQEVTGSIVSFYLDSEQEVTIFLSASINATSDSEFNLGFSENGSALDSCSSGAVSANAAGRYQNFQGMFSQTFAAGFHTLQLLEQRSAGTHTISNGRGRITASL